MSRRLSVLLCMLLTVAIAVPPAVAQDDPPIDGRYQGDGDAGGYWNIIPPGQDGGVNAVEALAAQGGTFPDHFTDQTPLYEDLVYEGGLPVAGTAGEPFLGITDGDIERFFKDGSFGAAGDVVEVDVSACGDDVVAFRDTAFGVPHIYSTDRAQAQCANGYTTAEDRLFLMDALRHVGYARLSEFLGASEANKAMDRGQLLVAPYVEEDYVQQEADLCESSDPERLQICADGTAYIEGVNHFISATRTNLTLLPVEYPALQVVPEEFVLRDILAIASLVGGIFGKGGGNEAANSMFMAALVEQHGEAQARAIFDDLKAANDPDASLTIQAEFPYNTPADIDGSTTALLDPDSFVGAFGDESAGGVGLPAAARSTTLGVVDGPFGPMDLRTPLGMSNAILATADVTDSGVPIAVFGPQTGYFTPQLLHEFDIHAPGIDARGTAFAGTNIYVQLGRGNDYAWSATSASGDLVDEWALELCDPDGGAATIESTGYVWDGTCAEIPVLTHTQVAKPTAAGIPSSPSLDNIVFTLEIGRIPELDDAPVVGRAVTTDGVPVAIAEQRSTFKAELASAIGFARINDPDFMTDGTESFNRAFDGIDFTFNWFYIDDTDIAYRHTCLCPIRDDATDPDLLTWAGRGHQWTGAFLAPADQPQSVNPEEGFYANWNNKQAPGFRSQDDTWKHHSTDRREHLAVRMESAIASGRPLTRGDMVNIAEDAGTVDINGQEVYPLALQIMGAEAPDDLTDADATITDPDLLEAMRDQLAAWVAAGGHRRDVDRDGTYDHAVAVAIGDAWLRPMVEQVMADEVPLEHWPEGVEDHPRQGQGSAYNSGRIRFLQKDFWQVLDLPMQQPRSRTYCGEGDLAVCARHLWVALAEAAEILSSTPGAEGAERQLPLPGLGGEASCAYPDAVQFGTSTVTEWVYPADCDNIVQSALGVVGAPEMRWVNRPTFQQVVESGTVSGRIAGPSRTVTAAAASRHAWPDGADTVVLAAAGSFADAVAGTPLAADRDAPLLLTDTATLTPVTAHEIGRLGATDVVLLGGTAAISDDVADELAAEGLGVTRIGGANRFETAVLIAEALGQATRFVLANGGTFADALAAGPFAAADDRAILLTGADALPDGVADVLAGAEDVVLAGGTTAVDDSVAAEVAGLGADVSRVDGATRYETANAFALEAIDAGASAATAYVVTGEDFPDALSAGAVAARSGGVLVLLHPAGLAQAAANAALVLEQADRVWFVGGTAVLPSALRQDLERRM